MTEIDVYKHMKYIITQLKKHWSKGVFSNIQHWYNLIFEIKGVPDVQIKPIAQQIGCDFWLCKQLIPLLHGYLGRGQDL